MKRQDGGEATGRTEGGCSEEAGGRGSRGVGGGACPSLPPPRAPSNVTCSQSMLVAVMRQAWEVDSPQQRDTVGVAWRGGSGTGGAGEPWGAGQEGGGGG